MAATKVEAEKAFDLFGDTFRAKYGASVTCLDKDREALLAFYDFPAEHWIHLLTTNPIESTFATVRLRTRKAKGSGSRIACLTMLQLGALLALISLASGTARGGPVSAAARSSVATRPGRSAELVLQEFYEQHGADLNRCIFVVFGSDAVHVPWQCYQDRPEFEFHPAAVLSRGRAGLVVGLPVPRYLTDPAGRKPGPFGTVLVASEFDPMLHVALIPGFLRVFIHELGNLLDLHLNGLQAGGLTYGNPSDPIDSDTGQALERCLDRAGVFNPAGDLLSTPDDLLRRKTAPSRP